MFTGDEPGAAKMRLPKQRRSPYMTDATIAEANTG